VAEDERAQAQRGGGSGHGRQRRHRGQVVAEVVRHEQGRVPEILGSTSLLGPRARRPCGGLAQLGGETEGVLFWHGVIVPHLEGATPTSVCSVAAGVAPPAVGAAVMGMLGSHLARALRTFGKGPERRALTCRCNQSSRTGRVRRNGSGHVKEGSPGATPKGAWGR